MSLLINRETRILVQGITGAEGLFHTRISMQYPIPVVAGVTPGKGGEWVFDGKIPVYDCVKHAVDVSGANTSIIFVPACQAADSILEAADAGIKQIVCISEGIPIHNMMTVKSFLLEKEVTLIGPNSPGILIPDKARIGIIPPDISFPGNIGVVSRSGTLIYEVASILRDAGIGTSMCIGIGSDPVVGTGFADMLDWFNQDENTDKVVLVGEIGGYEEQAAAAMIRQGTKKPVVAYIAGQTAPSGKQMGHVGAIIENLSGTAANKISALKEAGALIAEVPEQIPELLQ